MSDTVEEQTPDEGADVGIGVDDDDEIVVLSWWHNPINLIIIAVGLVLVMGTLGWVIGNNQALPDPNKVDVGFLQDMHWHHDQAVTMALIYMSLEDTDPALRQIAEEILVGQNQEIGLMIQMLRDFGQTETNETDTGMTWMGHPTPLDSMPGMATEAQLDQLQASSGAAADELFVQLMSAHHQGGIEMAKYAAQYGNEPQVTKFANQIATNQQEEIAEMQRLLEASRS